jgi:hypothetical protein
MLIAPVYPDFYCGRLPLVQTISGCPGWFSMRNDDFHVLESMKILAFSQIGRWQLINL